MRALERMLFTRVVATPAAIDRAVWPTGALVLRIAQDEVLAAGTVDLGAVPDQHAIVEPETAFCGAWVDHKSGIQFLEHACDWELPAERPAFAQGAVAGIPVKVWFEAERILFLVPVPFVIDFAERWS